MLNMFAPIRTLLHTFNRHDDDDDHHHHIMIIITLKFATPLNNMLIGVITSSLSS
jgi:hypothetical protein